MPSAWIRGARAVRILVALLFTAYNIVPLCGLWAWHWDAFQLLMLYWSETVVLATWMIVRLVFVPTNLVGDITAACDAPGSLRDLPLRSVRGRHRDKTPKREL